MRMTQGRITVHRASSDNRVVQYALVSNLQATLSPGCARASGQVPGSCRKSAASQLLFYKDLKYKMAASGTTGLRPRASLPGSSMATPLVLGRPPKRNARRIRVQMTCVARYSLVLALLIATASGALCTLCRSGTNMLLNRAAHPCDG
jgi:hypothetical protein